MEAKLDRATLEAVAKLADERRLPHFASELRDLGKPFVSIRIKRFYLVLLNGLDYEFDTRKEAEDFVRGTGGIPEMDYSDEIVIELTEADIVPEEPPSHLLPCVDVVRSGCDCERCTYLRSVGDPLAVKPANGPPEMGCILPNLNLPSPPDCMCHACTRVRGRSAKT